MKSTIDEEQCDLMEMALGQLKPGEKAVVEVQMVSVLTSAQGRLVARYPMDFIVRCVGWESNPKSKEATCLGSLAWM